MPFALFETDDLKKLSDIDLIKRHDRLCEMISKSTKSRNLPDTYKQMCQLEEAYMAEIDRRYEEGIIDEDEIDEMMEREYDNV